MFSFFQRKKSDEKRISEDVGVSEFGKKQMRELADIKTASSNANSIMYMRDGSGYLYVSMLVYICRAGKNMNIKQRKIIVDFVKRNYNDIEVSDSDIERELKSWITPSRQQYAIDVNSILEDSNVDIMMDIFETSKQLVSTLKEVDKLQVKALEKLSIKFDFKLCDN